MAQPFDLKISRWVQTPSLTPKIEAFYAPDETSAVNFEVFSFLFYFSSIYVLQTY